MALRKSNRTAIAFESFKRLDMTGTNKRRYTAKLGHYLKPAAIVWATSTWAARRELAKIFPDGLVDLSIIEEMDVDSDEAADYNS